jgi:Uma2 family endonuclease
MVYTPEELPALENGNGTYELVDGHLVEKHMGAEAAVVEARLITDLGSHVKAQKAGLVFTDDCGYQIFPGDPNRVRKPDVSYVSREKVPPGRIPRGYVRFVPDLVAEVVSPNDLAEEVEARVADYLGVGVTLIWILYPATSSVHIFRPDGSGNRLTGTGELRGESVLPGFVCRIEELFEEISSSDQEPHS